MPAFPAEAALSYSDFPPVLIAGDSDGALLRASQTVASAGFRIADQVSLTAAPARIDLQASASAVWIELDGDGGGPMDYLLDHISRDVREGRYAAVVAANRDMVDPLAARIHDSAIEIVIDGDEVERAAALAVATSVIRRPAHLSDVVSDQNNARLRQLSDEVSRIAATLARLSTGPGQPVRSQEAPRSNDVPEVSVDTVRAVIRARRLRSRYFAEELFADPAWDMLLDLLQAELAQLRVPVSSLCIAAAVPATTALRWLKTMTAQGLFVRRADPHDGRRVFVELDPSASLALRRYFAEVGNPATI